MAAADALAQTPPGLLRRRPGQQIPLAPFFGAAIIFSNLFFVLAALDELWQCARFGFLPFLVKVDCAAAAVAAAGCCELVRQGPKSVKLRLPRDRLDFDDGEGMGGTCLGSSARLEQLTRAMSFRRDDVDEGTWPAKKKEFAASKLGSQNYH